MSCLLIVIFSELKHNQFKSGIKILYGLKFFLNQKAPTGILLVAALEVVYYYLILYLLLEAL